MIKKIFFTYLFAILLMTSLTGCSSQDASANEQDNQVAYYCRATKKIVVTTKQKVPGINPETGRRTLLSTMYCEQCKQWHPVPPVEIMRRNPTAGVCRRCKKRLVPEGPLPEKTN